MHVDDIKLDGKEQNNDPIWKVLDKEVDLEEPTSFFDLENLGFTHCGQLQSHVQIANFRGEN